MKRFLSLPLFVLMTLGFASAQDTLFIHPSDWPDNYFKADWWQEYDSLAYYFFVGGGHIGGDQEGFLMITEDTLTIYGLAVCASTYELIDTNIYINHPDLLYKFKDTSYDQLFDYFYICAADSCSIRQISEDLVVHIKHTPVSYYLNTGLRRSNDPANPLPIIPVYERYFIEPVTVADSFYLGRRYFAHQYIGNDPYMWTTKELLVFCLRNGMQIENQIQYAWRQDSTAGLSEHHTFDLSYYKWFYAPVPSGPMIFPILTPEDTTEHRGDSLSIGSASLLDRLTGVMPNPATCSAKVVSSLGLREVAVYNAAGDLVHRQQADGLSTTLDTRPWPAGTYMLRITTPSGTATKKLVVTR